MSGSCSTGRGRLLLHSTTRQRKAPARFWVGTQVCSDWKGKAALLPAHEGRSFPAAIYKGENNAEAHTWKKRFGSLGSRARLHGQELFLRPAPGQAGDDIPYRGRPR